MALYKTLFIIISLCF